MASVAEDEDVLGDLLSYLGNDDGQLLLGTMANAPRASSSSIPPSLLHGSPELLQMLPSLQARQSAEEPGPSARDSGGGGGSKRRRDADKVKELEALAAAKADQFASLVQRNAELKFKNRILSDAVQLRDYQLRIARAGVHEPPPLLPPPAAAAMATASGRPSAAEGRSGAGGASSSSGGGGGDGSQPWLAAGSMAEAVRVPGSVHLLHAPDVLPQVDPERLRSIGRQQLLDMWRATLAECSALLLALGTNPADEAAAGQMRKHLGEASFLFRHVSVHAPEVMMAFVQTHIETGALCAPEPGHWHRVMQSLELTSDQVAYMRAVYAIFSSIMASILADRREIKAQMSEGLQQQTADPRVMPASMLLSPESKVLPALERNMRKESAAHLLVRGFLYGRTLSILQFCRAAVHSYPFFPCATGLAAAAAGVVE